MSILGVTAGGLGDRADCASAGVTDERRVALDRWVATQLGGDTVCGVAASSDASFRRYFRYHHGDDTFIAMDAPPAREDCRPFVAIAELFGRAGVHVPRVIARDFERGFLLLSDLGAQTYLEVFTEAGTDVDALFDDAIDALLCIQCATGAQSLPVYDEALLRRELNLFPEWYLGRHLGLDAAQLPVAALTPLFDLLVERALGQSRVPVHRDYMPRNLMLATPNPGVLDFQDAVFGPISYDPICLFKDAFISWPSARVVEYLRRYWGLARERGLPVPRRCEDFRVDCDLMGVQRHLKVMGIFARICYRDGKPRYLRDAPRFIRYLEEVAQRYIELAPLREILELLRRAHREGVA